MKLKPNWGEIENFLRDYLKKTKYILTFGTIGSTNLNTDIDLIITKKRLSPSDKFYKEIHELFDNLNNFLEEKYGYSTIRFALSYEEDLIHSISNEEKAILFHTMVYVSYSQLEKDWDWAMFKDESIKNIILEDYNCLLGSPRLLFSNEFSKEKYYESIFNYLYYYDKIHSKLPEKLLIKIMDHGYDYILRKRLGSKGVISKNSSEVRDNFYKICRIVDQLELRKSK